jgi:hypothetical protein
MSDNDTARTFQVVLGNMAYVTDALEALTKRCLRRGLVPVTYAWGKAYTKTEHRGDGPCDHSVDCRGCREVSRIPLTITGQTPRYQGWTFAAALTHVEGETVVRAASEIPKVYRARGPVCDHCKVARRRSETYVVEHDDGRTHQVGSTCIADFLGSDEADKIASGASSLFSACGIGEDGENDSGRSGSSAILLETYLTMVAWCVRTEGWVSRTAARERCGRATADAACTYISDSEARQRAGATPTEADKALAKDAALWAESLSDETLEKGSGDYLHNLRVVARLGYVTSKLMGVGASMIVAYERHLGQERARADRAARPASEHVGIPGERSVFDATLDFVTGYESDFGYVKVLKFVSPAGAVLVWKTTSSGLERSDVGKRYIVRGSVKAHAEFKGIKQTVLSRADLSPFDQVVFDKETTEARRKVLAASVKAGKASTEEREELAALEVARKAGRKADKAKIAACMNVETVAFMVHYPCTHTALQLRAHENIVIDSLDRNENSYIVVTSPSETRYFDGAKAMTNAREFVASLLAGVV